MEKSGLPLRNSRTSDFIDGWHFLERKKDISDFEWELWTDFIFSLIPWLILHLSVAEITRLIFIEALPLCYFLTTFAVLLTNFPIVVPAFYVFILICFFAAMMSGFKLMIWCFGVFFVIFINYYLKSSVLPEIMLHDQANLVYVSFGWFYIRCLDFVLSEVGKKGSISVQFINYLGYIFYLPCFFLGPFMPYDHFKFQISTHPGNILQKRVCVLFFSALLHSAFYIFYEAASHVFYCNAMHYEIRDFIPFGMWTLSGVGICMATFFYLKYVIIYGISNTIANMENYTISPRPKCIYRIHLYSKMWRHFDRGFYLFMFRCIYSPICQNRQASICRRTFASFLCFLFVYIWHGGTLSILYWSAFNFIGLICEAVWKHFWKSSYFFKVFVVKNISETNIRRIVALAASPLWLFAVISNFMFFGGYEMGFVFIEQLLQGSFIFYATLITIAYSMCQVSIEIEMLENQEYMKVSCKKESLKN